MILSRCIINGITYDQWLDKRKFAVSCYFKLFSTDLGSTQIFCTIRLADRGTKPGTAMQCKTKGSSCHRQSSVRFLSVIRAAQSSVFCVVFLRPLFIIFSFFDWLLHCIPITLLTSTNKLFLSVTYSRTTILSQLSNLFHCSIYATLFFVGLFHSNAGKNVFYNFS